VRLLNHDHQSQPCKFILRYRTGLQFIMSANTGSRSYDKDDGITQEEYAGSKSGMHLKGVPADKLELYLSYASKDEEWRAHHTKNLLRKVDIRLLPLLVLMYLLNFLDRSNLAQARLGSLEKDLGMKGTDFNLATSILFVVSFLAIPWECVADSTGLSLDATPLQPPSHQSPALDLSWHRNGFMGYDFCVSGRCQVLWGAPCLSNYAWCCRGAILPGCDYADVVLVYTSRACASYCLVLFGEFAGEHVWGTAGCWYSREFEWVT